MDDLFSLDIDFQRVCWTTVIGFFVLALFYLLFWSVFIYFPQQQRIDEIKKFNESAKEFYVQKGLPVPENILNPEELK